MRCGRADLAIGIVGVIGGAIALIAATAHGLAGTAVEGNITDTGAVASQPSNHLGHTTRVLFAIILLDASLSCANVAGLATTYAHRDALRRPHSGVLLICDACFDVMTAKGADLLVSVVTAALGELPLAIILIGGTLRTMRDQPVFPKTFVLWAFEVLWSL